MVPCQLADCSLTPLGARIVARLSWEYGQTEIIIVYHVTGHLPLASPGNDGADELAEVCWLEGKPTSDVVQWLHHHLLHVGQKTMWAVAHQWGLPLTFEEDS